MMVDTPSALTALASRLLHEPVVAVDTEFFWERTYYPVLGIVQLAVDESSCWLVDAVKIRDLAPLAPLLAAPGVSKVLHDAVQDLRIVGRVAGVTPRNVFDTRLAAGFAGRSSTLSLQALLREVLGVELAKAETRSNWLRRPLSPGQLAYAAEDVVHLPALRQVLVNGCANATVRGWMFEALSALGDPRTCAEPEPREQFRRVKGASRLQPAQRAVLRELAAWREEEARRRDWPRGHVLADEVLVEVALRAPVEVAALAAIAGVPPRLPADVRETLVRAIRAGVACPGEEHPRAPSIRPEQRRSADRLLEAVRRRAVPLGIDPALVASRADAEAWAAADAGARAALPLGSGWRRALLGEDAG